MKKIGLIVPNINFIGGAEKVAINMYYNLKKTFDIEIISLYGEENNTKYRDLKCIFFKQKEKNILSRIFILKKYKKQLLKYDIIIGNNFFRYLAIPLFLDKKVKKYEIQHLCYEEGLEEVKLLKRLKLIIRNHIYRFLNGLIVLTEREKQLFTKTGLKNIKVIPNGTFLELKQSSLNNKVALAIGRLSEQKNFVELIKIWEKICQFDNEWVLEIYGEGEERETIYQEIKKRGLINRVLLKGVTTDMDKVWLKGSMLIMTSKYEGFPMVMIEAMTFGVPVISFDYNSGPKDIITDSIDGFRIEKNNKDEMVEKIKLLIGNIEMRKRFGNNAKQNIKKYSWDKISKVWKCFLEEELDEKNN